MDIFVILRETGEYSGRMVSVIGYVCSEDEAKAAIERAEVEKHLDRRPAYVRHSTYAYFDSKGVAHDIYALDDRARGMRWGPLPNIDEIEAENERLEQAYRNACLSLGHVDPDGCSPDATYFYEPARRYVSALQSA